MTLSAPATLLTAAVTLLAVLVALWTAILVSRARRRRGIQPPAMTGSPDLECALRVQGNTVEQFILFLPALWVAALYFQGWIPPIIGLIWCVGRILLPWATRRSSRARGRRALHSTIFSTLVLIVLGAIGIVQAWMAVSAT